MAKLPLCSSKQVCGVLERVGFECLKKKAGSHQSYVRELPDGRKISVVVIIGKKEMTRGTLKRLLARAELSESDFLKLLK